MNLKEKVLKAINEHPFSTLFVVSCVLEGKTVTFIDGNGEKRLKGEEALKEHFRGIYRCSNGYDVSEEELEKAYKIFKKIVFH